MRNDFKNKTFDELIALREKLREEAFEMKFKFVVGHVESPISKRTVRRQIARINTRLHELAERELEKGNGSGN